MKYVKTGVGLPFSCSCRNTAWVEAFSEAIIWPMAHHCVCNKNIYPSQPRQQTRAARPELPYVSLPTPSELRIWQQFPASSEASCSAREPAPVWVPTCVIWSSSVFFIYASEHVKWEGWWNVNWVDQVFSFKIHSYLFGLCVCMRTHVCIKW